MIRRWSGYSAFFALSSFMRFWLWHILLHKILCCSHPLISLVGNNRQILQENSLLVRQSNMDLRVHTHKKFACVTWLQSVEDEQVNRLKREEMTREQNDNHDDHCNSVNNRRRKFIPWVTCAFFIKISSPSLYYDFSYSVSLDFQESL